MSRLIETKTLLKMLAAIAGIAVVVHLAIITSLGRQLHSFKDYWELATSGGTVTVIFYLAFSRWFWKNSLFQGWLIKLPDLTGTWLGEEISYTFTEDSPNSVCVSIDHEFEKMTFTARHKGSENTVLAAQLAKDDVSNCVKLIVTYENRRVGQGSRHTSPHLGCYVMTLKRPKNEKSATEQWKLEGDYWTNKSRQTSDPKDYGTHGTICVRWSTREPNRCSNLVDSNR